MNTLPYQMHLVNNCPRYLWEVLAAHMAAMGLTAADSDRLFFGAPSGGLLSYPELAQAGVAPCG